MSSFDYNNVRNPEIFMQNRMKAHSDHVFYLAENGGEAFDGRLFFICFFILFFSFIYIFFFIFFFFI